MSNINKTKKPARLKEHDVEPLLNGALCFDEALRKIFVFALRQDAVLVRSEFHAFARNCLNSKSTVDEFLDRLPAFAASFYGSAVSDEVFGERNKYKELGFYHNAMKG